MQLEWWNRSGAVVGRAGDPGPYAGFALSPEGTRVAILRENRVSRADQDVWLLDLTRDRTTRLSTDPTLESVPAWSSDGQDVIFAVGHGSGDIWAQSVGGAAGRQLLSRSAHPEIRINPLLTTLSASADGRFLVFTAEAAARARSDLWVLSRKDDTAAPLLQQEFSQTQGAISPDGRWLAYASNESGINEVFVRRLADEAGSVFPRRRDRLPPERAPHEPRRPRRRRR